jgi:hypothetical protein
VVPMPSEPRISRNPTHHPRAGHPGAKQKAASTPALPRNLFPKDPPRSSATEFNIQRACPTRSARTGRMASLLVKDPAVRSENARAALPESEP